VYQEILHVLVFAVWSPVVTRPEGGVGVENQFRLGSKIDFIVCFHYVRWFLRQFPTRSRPDSLDRSSPAMSIKIGTRPTYRSEMFLC